MNFFFTKNPNLQLKKIFLWCVCRGMGGPGVGEFFFTMNPNFLGKRGEGWG